MARACIAGDDIIGPFIDDKGNLDVRRARVVNATLHWDASLGHRGSVVLVIDGDKIGDAQRARERTFLDIVMEGWEPVPDGADLRKLRAKLKANIKRNQRRLRKSS